MLFLLVPHFIVKYNLLTLSANRNLILATCNKQTSNTHKPFYNSVHYNTVLDITQFKDGSQKYKNNIEKMTINGHFSI